MNYKSQDRLDVNYAFHLKKDRPTYWQNKK